MTETMRTIHVVDDDEAIRHSVGFLLRKAGFHVETYVSGTAFLKAVDRETRGCVLLDVRMPVIILTGHGDVTLAVRAVKAGAIEFLEKPFERSALLKAIEEALDHANRGERSHLAAADALVRLSALTPRERDVLDGMVLGRPNKLIAYDLHISTRTVEVHRAKLMEKLGSRSLSDVLRIAFIGGLGEAVRAN